jgi:hypothetical protein
MVAKIPYISLTYPHHGNDEKTITQEGEISSCPLDIKDIQHQTYKKNKYRVEKVNP